MKKLALRALAFAALTALIVVGAIVWCEDESGWEIIVEQPRLRLNK